MKILFILLFLLTSCATTNVYYLKHFLNFSNSDLAKESATYYKESKLDDVVPSAKEKNAYYSSLGDMITYRSYLLTECIMILNKEHGLTLENPIYVSVPKWNNVQNWYATVFSYSILKNQVPTETKAECDLVINNKKEVESYQVIEYYTNILKN